MQESPFRLRRDGLVHAEWLPWVLLAALAARLYWRVSKLAVDIPHWDQWDLWEPLFDDSGFWTFFRWQHGPPRQGLGGLVLWASARASGLSVLAETFVSASILIVGAALFLLLARRLLGHLDVLDAALPLILLGGFTADAITLTPNPAHGPVPFFLLCATLWCFTVSRLVLRLPLLVLLNFVAIYTGFAFLLVPLVLAVQIVDLWQAPPQERAAHTVALIGSVLFSATFFIGYVPMTAASCFVFPDPQPLRYGPFFVRLLGRLWGAGWRFPGIAVAIVSALAMVACAVWGAWRTLFKHTDWLGRGAFLLCGFAVLFATATTVGRTCFGLGAAGSVHYLPYVLPGFAYAYVLLRAWTPPSSWRSVATAVILIGCVWREVFLMANPAVGTGYMADAKRRFRDCLRAGGSGAQCSLETNYQPHPEPAATHLEEKLKFLREHRLGPFRD